MSYIIESAFRDVNKLKRSTIKSQVKTDKIKNANKTVNKGRTKEKNSITKSSSRRLDTLA